MGDLAAPASIRDEDQGYPLVGETIGMWRLIKGIGRGGMGEVYAAEYDFEHLFALHTPPEGRETVKREIADLPRVEQARLASRVLGLSLPAEKRFAIKICNARTGTAGYKRFLQEAHLAQKLGDHPYIITVHWINGDDGPDGVLTRLAIDRGRHRDLAFMVMDLAECTFQRERLTLGEAVHIIRCIASALDHAHTQGIIHRDLKPENILGSIDHPYLTDFGIAKEIDGTDGLTRTGQIIGTLDYMSPEQATDAKNVDHRSDIYSLGTVLYEFATSGQLPYAHKQDRDSCLAAIRSRNYEPKWPREQIPGFPRELERVVLKAMAFDRKDRYQTMAEFISDLDRFTRGEPIGWWGRVKVRSMLKAQARFNPRWVVGLSLGLVLLILIPAIVILPKVFDGTARKYGKTLDEIARETEKVVQGQAMQLDRGNRDNLAALEKDLAMVQGYDDLRTRLAEIQDQLLRYRQLTLDFRLAPAEKDQGKDSGKELLKELALASGAKSPAWHLDKNRGLILSQDQEAEFKPYGRGTLATDLVVDLPVGFNSWVLAAAEADDPSHRIWWEVSVVPASAATTGRPVTVARLMRSEDAKQPRMLRQETLFGTRIAIGFQLTPQGIVSRVIAPSVSTADVRHDGTGLRDLAPATVRLRLPRDSQVDRLVIQPRVW